MITSLRTRILLITTTAVTTALVLTGGATYAIVRSATLQTIEENLAAIASGNTLAIEKWVTAKATAVTATAAVVEPGDPKGLVLHLNKSGGFPVTGSLSRSAVNFAAGARTQLAGVITAALLAGALVLPTGWLALLPLPVLAATIIVAVLGLLDWSTLRTAWDYDRADALALLATAGGVLLLGVEAGVVAGLLLSLGTMIWRESRPHIAVLGRIPHTEHFRNIDRYSAETDPNVLLLRVDAGLFFGNIEAVSERIEEVREGKEQNQQEMAGIAAHHPH